MHEFIQEVEYSVSLGACDRLDLDPLGELVDSHQYSVKTTWRSWQWPNHVEPQQAKGQVGGMVTSL
jgi:hypothetical protein